MNQFGTSFYGLVMNSIEKCAKVRSSIDNHLDKYDSELIEEIIDHAHMCQANATKFHGRQKLIKKVFLNHCFTYMNLWQNIFY